MEEHIEPLESSGSPQTEASYQPSEQSQSATENVYEAFKSLPEFSGKDDIDIARSLYSSMQGQREAQQSLAQYQQILPYANEYLKNQSSYETWKRSQAEASRPAEPVTPKWWSPPEVRDGWKNFIVRDPSTGREHISPDAPLDAQNALREYQTYTADFARKLVTDPENTLKPFIEQIASAKAAELVQQNMGQYQASNYVSSLERQNADWLYDQNGQVSREGQAIQHYISEASQIGIANPQARWKYATGMLQRDILNARHEEAGAQQHAYAQQAAAQQAAQQAPRSAPQDPVAAGNMQFLRERATRQPNRSAGQTEPRTRGVARMNFEERLRGQLTNDGVI